MKNKLRENWDNLKPSQKKLVVIIGALGAVMASVALFQPATNQRDRGYNKNTDQVRNVLTDRSSKGQQLDILSGNLNRQSDELSKLAREVEALKKREREASIRQQKELQDEVEKLRAELNDIKSAGTIAPTTDSLFKEPEPSENETGESGSSKSSSRAQKVKPIKMSVIKETKKREQKKAEKDQEETAAYIPAGSIITGTIITGGDFPTNAGGFENPTPLLIRISKEAILPNRRTSDVRECFLLAGGRGDLASERVKLRGEMLSCIRNDGSVIESKLNSYVAGEDGKEGVRGRLVSKQGQIIARSLAAGFASGLSDAFDVNQVPTITTSTDGTVQYEKVFSKDALQGAAVKGFSNSLERISQFYLDMAKDIFPVVEVNAGRQVDVIVISGTKLKISAKGAFAQPQANNR